MKKSFTGNNKFYSKFEKAAQVLCCLIEKECIKSHNWGRLCFQVFKENLEPQTVVKELYAETSLMSPDEFVDALCAADDELVIKMFGIRYPRKYDYRVIVGCLACGETFSAIVTALELSDIPIPAESSEDDFEEI